jgi:hypothetical protein
VRLEDLRLGERRVLVVEGKGGHDRLIPLSPTFFATVGDYLRRERPSEATTDRVFVVLKGQRRGRPLSTEGLDEILSAARKRAGVGARHLPRVASHMLDPAARSGDDPGGVASGSSPLVSTTKTPGRKLGAPTASADLAGDGASMAHPVTSSDSAWAIATSRSAGAC